ncbi:WD40 repeat-like protein [Sparassis crispa]|uniref:WD40 repeat-like protein n=1 Tax=Sparassis crispa TaxID=139825 RepID=A0A401GEJ7_9APHY|nr:WD40 repeat-like protein [Sparassis crispa]GBE80545.1 WD40 repeat-like protein [Sparassis crispa]
MVAQTEKRLLWHPGRENKFVVGGGTQLTLYEWVPESSEIKQVTSQLDLTLMKCFAWSPDKTFDDLVAVGLSNGRVDLMRLEATKYARDHVLSSGPCVSLPARNSRSCNALAFSPVDANYLAVGLDKVRNDSSLVIWDIHTATPSLSLGPTVPSATTLNAPLPTVRSHSHIPRGDVGPRADSRILQQHAPADTVSSVAFLPHSPTLLLAGISHRWLRLFDLRDPLAAPTTVASKVHGIATDPLEPHRIGCFGEGVATIWDTRHLTQPLLTFTEKDASADGARARPSSVFVTMEFSSTRRGVLATLERDAHHVRFWDLQQAATVELHTSPSERSRDSSQSGKVTRSWTNPSSMLPWTGSSLSSSHTSQARPTSEHQAEPYYLMLSDTRRTKAFSKPLSSFALVPSTETHPLTSNILVVNKEGDLELYAVHDTPKHTPWSVRGDLAIGIGCSYRILPGFHELGPPPEPWDILMQPSIPGSKAQSVDRNVRDESSVRGRGGHGTPAPTFGRGDEDGFPALPARTPTNLAATRPGRSRTYSPAALRNLHFEHSAVPKTDVHPPALLSVPKGEYALPLNGGSHKERRTSSRHTKDLSPGKSSTGITIQHVVEEDVSMTMRRRVIQGYGLVNPLHNSIVARDTSDEPILAELWLWIHHAQRLLSDPTPRLEGYNFAYQGLSGIWEGLRSSQSSSSAHPTPRMPQRSMPLDSPTLAMSTLASESHVTRTTSRRATRRRSHPPAPAIPEDFLAAIKTLNERCATDRSSWQPSATTSKLSQRQFALQLCGWSLCQDDLAHAIRRWEKENRHSQAACWLVFTDQHKSAVDLLMRSKDESHHMMSGMLAALAPSASNFPSRNHELIAHCEKLIVRLQDPYLRAMLTYLTLRDWSEVLLEEALPLRERLAIAFQFLDDRELSAYLRRVADRCCHDGDIEGLVVTGLTAVGMDILQTYLDITGDIQTVAVLSALSPARAQDARARRWLDAYRDLLDGWRLFHHRCQLDIDRGRILQEAIAHADIAPFEWAPRQIVLRCNYCGAPMDPPFDATHHPRATACPHCSRPLPRCSICLMTLSIVQDTARNAALARSEARDTIDDALVFCQTCRHGGHASHILQWFYGEDRARTHGTCPVAGCDCRCAEEF